MVHVWLRRRRWHFHAFRRDLQELQRSLLPADLPTLPGIELAARYPRAFAAVVRVQAAWRCRVGAQALGVAKSSAVALQSALRGKSGREAARRRPHG